MRYCEGPHDWVPLEFLTLSLAPQSGQQFMSYGLGFPNQAHSHGWFPLLSLYSTKHDSLCLPVHLPSIEVKGLPYVLPSLMGPRKVVDFSICSDFYFF